MAKPGDAMRIDRPVSQRQSWWLLATALAAFLPLTPQLPVPLALGAGTVMALRALISWRQWHLPPRWLLTLVTLCGAAAVLWEYRTIFGRTPGIAFLAVFLALKLLELRVARDALALVLLAYFLVLANFMFTQTCEHAGPHPVGISKSKKRGFIYDHLLVRSLYGKSDRTKR